MHGLWRLGFALFDMPTIPVTAKDRAIWSIKPQARPAMLSMAARCKAAFMTLAEKSVQSLHAERHDAAIWAQEP